MSSIKLLITDDGSPTLYLGDLDEIYHSRRGALSESKHVYIEAGLKQFDGQTLRILEMGFGTGMNAWLTFRSLRPRQRIDYFAYEKYPIELDMVKQLIKFPPFNDDPEFFDFHQQQELKFESFHLQKNTTDFAQANLPSKIDLVFYDAFAPDKQPELWTSLIFKKILDGMNPGGVLVTYSAKGSVKRALKEAGWKVEVLDGPPGKREMVRANVA